MPLGLYASRCGGEVDRTVDLDTALADARSKSAVVRVFDDFFDPDVIAQMVADVRDAGLDSVVLAGNSPAHYIRGISTGYVRDRLVDAGVNPNRIVAANLLEQVALAHPDKPEAASEKARALVNVAVLRATMAQNAEATLVEPRRSVAILGVTAEAIVAAQRLLRMGYSIVLADRGDGAETGNHAKAMRATRAFVIGHPDARVINSARLADGDGWLGDYRLVIESDSGTATFNVGGILLARPEHTEWVDELRQHFKVDIDDSGFARSIDPSTHPAETIEPGIMVVPLRRENALERDKVAAADAAAMALVLRLSQASTRRYRNVSAVDETLCGGCASCVRTCAFGACYLDDEGLSHVDERRCRACGKCVVGCPVGARDILSSPHDYLLAAVRELATTQVEGEKVLGFLCSGCGYPAADRAANAVAERGDGYAPAFLPLQITCGGRLDTLYVLEAFKQGFDGVAVYRCREGHCNNLIGNLDMDRRINLLRTVLRSRKLDDARLRIVDISPNEGERFIESVEDVYQTIGGLTNGKGGPQ